jgi:hypothetical protein
MIYNSVSLDREILARQDHLEKTKLKTPRASPSETSEREMPRGLETGGESLLGGPHATKQIWNADRILPALPEIPMQSRL